MARCAAGCSFIDEVHDFGCPERFKGCGGEPPELLQLYGTETPNEAMLIDAILMHLLVEADLSTYDPEEVHGDDATWLVLRRRVRQLGSQVLDRPLPLHVAWDPQQEVPHLHVTEEEKA
jgi:hypothetical protein